MVVVGFIRRGGKRQMVCGGCYRADESVMIQAPIILAGGSPAHHASREDRVEEECDCRGHAGAAMLDGMNDCRQG